MSRCRSEGTGNGKRFPLPPALSKLPPGRQRLPKQFIDENRRNRIVLAALEVFGKRGYTDPTVADLLTEASVSRATFYKYFADKEACFRALHEEVLAWLEQRARDAATGAEDWRSAVVAVSRCLIGLLDEDPRLARICTVEWVLGASQVRSHHEAMVGRLAAGLREGRAECPWAEQLPQCAELFVLAGAASLISRTTVFGLGPDAEALSVELPEVILVHYLGAEEAQRAARKPG